MNAPVACAECGKTTTDWCRVRRGRNLGDGTFQKPTSRGRWAGPLCIPCAEIIRAQIASCQHDLKDCFQLYGGVCFAGDPDGYWTNYCPKCGTYGINQEPPNAEKQQSAV